MNTTLLKRLPRPIWMMGTAVLLVAACVGAKQYLNRDADAAVQTARVEQGDLEKTVTSVGSLKPKDYVDVGTQVSGRVETVHVDIGDRVQKGDLIAEIDPTVYESTVRKDQANLDNLRAQLRQQQAELVLAREQLARNERMVKSNAVSQDTVDQASAAAKVADAAVAATRAQIKAAEATLAGDVANLGYTKIYAPLSGTVVSQSTLEGQTVNSVQSAPVIVQVANLDVMTVWAQVAEADVNKLKPGMPAYFTTLGMPERRWRGTVRQVQPTPTTTNDVVLYYVLIDVENPEGLLLPSMTVQVFFVLGEAKSVPIVPLNALKPDRKSGGYRVTVLTSEGPKERAVTVGLTSRNSAQVVSGLKVGDEVVLPVQQVAKTGGRPERVPGGMGGPRL
jgi:membrane fusion protein, macrolide-specific efflux system